MSQNTRVKIVQRVRGMVIAGTSGLNYTPMT